MWFYSRFFDKTVKIVVQKQNILIQTYLYHIMFVYLMFLCQHKNIKGISADISLSDFYYSQYQITSIICRALLSNKYSSSFFFLEISSLKHTRHYDTSTHQISALALLFLQAGVVGHCKAKGTAVGVQLPVTLAVACYIIYADLDLMEHMCVCSRHSSQIS